MTVVEFRRRKRRRVERKGMGMHGTVEGDLDFAEGRLERTRGGGGGGSSTLDPEMEARTEALARWIGEHKAGIVENLSKKIREVPSFRTAGDAQEVAIRFREP